MKTPTPGPFPLSIMESSDHYVIVTNHGSHYAKTFDPSAARLISAAPELLSALELLLDKLNVHFDDVYNDKHMEIAMEKAHKAIHKAKY